MRAGLVEPLVEYEDPAEDVLVHVRFHIDQRAFWDVAFDRKGLRYRGGYHTNDQQVIDADPAYPVPALPTVGNIFAYGADPGASFVGGVESVRDNGDVDMYVQVLARGSNPKHGTLRVTGLAFGKDIENRTLLFYYGGVAGDGNTVKKELLWSEPGSHSRRTTMNVDTVIGDASEAIVQQAWVTDIQVKSHLNIVVKAKTEVTDGNVHSHLYMAVVAPRSEGMFTRIKDSALERTETASLSTGNIYAPHFVVTQPLTAPILNPDFRNACIEPLAARAPGLPAHAGRHRLAPHERPQLQGRGEAANLQRV